MTVTTKTMAVVPKSRAEYASEISRRFTAIDSYARATVESIIAVGNLLIFAKAELKRGEFTAMVTEDIGLNMSAAQRFMRIADNAVLANPATLPHLPPSREVLNVLTKIPDAAIEKAVLDGEIHPELTMASARKLTSGILYPSAPTISGVVTSGPIRESEPSPTLTPAETAAGIAQDIETQVLQALAEVDDDIRERVSDLLMARLLPLIKIDEQNCTNCRKALAR